MVKQHALRTWGILILLCLTLGLAPHNSPHVIEKLRMLADGTLRRPIDWFDLVMHSTPWVLLVLYAVRSLVYLVLKGRL